MMQFKWPAFFLCAISFFGLAACGSPGTSVSSAAASSDGKLAVSVTFEAMKEFTEAVGGDKVSVTTIIPDGTEPHDFEPKAKDLTSLSKARLFVYNGLGMESWASQAVQAAGNTKLVTVEASRGAAALRASDAKEGQYDPHLWISLKGAELEVRNITAGLVQADPSNKAYYEQNSQTYLKKLEALYQTYAVKFKAAPRKDFVTGHAAFAYLCRDFGLEQHSVEDVFADGEPTAKQLTSLMDYCRKNHVTTIFSEEMVSPAISQTLAQGVGAQVQTIYTIESTENGASYLTRMQDNLVKIDDSLLK